MLSSSCIFLVLCFTKVVKIILICLITSCGAAPQFAPSETIILAPLLKATLHLSLVSFNWLILVNRRFEQQVSSLCAHALCEHIGRHTRVGKKTVSAFRRQAAQRGGRVQY